MRLFFVALPILLALSLFAAQTNGSVPSIDFSYAENFDGACAQQTKHKIDPAWVGELKSRMPEFTSAWAKDGPTLLRTSEEIVGKPFQDKQVSVSFSVCSLPSVSTPMLKQQ